MFKKDNLKFGILLGFATPILGLIICYFLQFYSNGSTFIEFLVYLKQFRTFLTAISSLSLFANAVVFTIYINGHRDKTARGIFVATVIYGVAVLLIKLVG